MSTTGDVRYVGRAESVATRKAILDGYSVRILSRDGNYFCVTRDMRHDRMNFNVVDGVVKRAEPG